MSTKYVFRIADNFKISKYVVGFIIIAIISIIPETLIAINSAINKVPSLGLGTLFGGNIADMTLVFAIIILFARRGIKIESKILKENIIYPFILLIPIVLGFDGFYSRREGIVLIIIGIIFYYLAFRKDRNGQVHQNIQTENYNGSNKKNILFLILSMIMLLIGSHFIVTSTISISNYLHISSVVIGMIIVGVGTTIPELFFSLSSVRNNQDSLAIGDILGTVLADATIVIGLLALINPFAFNPKIVYTTGIFMVISSFILFYFMRSGKTISKKEGYFLFFFWIIFVLIEIIFNS